jgi:peptide/nickel transport system substrate-binding protein
MRRPFPFLLLSALAGLALAGCPGRPSGGGATTGTGAGSGTNAAATGTYASLMGKEEEPPSVAGRYGGDFKSASISDPKTFNLWVSAETSSSDVLNPLYEPLNQRNSYTLKFEPRLAALPEISADGLTYTYRLKEGLTWSDGRPLTADDVIFTLDVVFDPTTQTIMREGMMVDVVGPDGSIKREPFKYRKVDGRTVEFTLPQKYAPAESIFSFPIAPRHKLEGPHKAGKFNSTWGVNTPPSELVSSGAWLIKEYAPGQRIVYTRNPRFSLKSKDGKQQPLPYLDQYVYLIVPDLNTTTLKFRSGDTDILGVQQPDYPGIKKDEEAKGTYEVMNRGPAWGFSYLGFNMNPESKVDKNLIYLFRDVRFRRAVSHAVNRDRIANDLFLGLAQPSYGPVTPANKAFYNPDVPKYEYDLDKAKALLAEIGLKDANNNGILEYQGKDVKFNILTNTENGLRKQMATIVAEDLKNIGLGAQFTPINFNDLVRRLDSPPYDWQAVILGFTGGPEPNDGSNIWRSSGPSHQWWPKQKKPGTEWEAEIDKLWVQGAQELDPAKRKQIYDRWQQIVGEQQPFTFLVTPEQITALNKGFGNVKPASLGVLWNLEEFFAVNAPRATP